MNNKEVVEEIKIILGQSCYFSNDCTINSLIIIEGGKKMELWRLCFDRYNKYSQYSNRRYDR